MLSSLNDLYSSFGLQPDRFTQLYAFHSRLCVAPLSNRRANRTDASASLLLTLTRLRPERGTSSVPSARPLASVVTSSVAEIAIVRQLLFTLVGVDGDLIRFDATTRHFHVAEHVLLSAPQRSVVVRLCELGRTYRRVDAFLRKAERQGGAVLQALASGVRAAAAAYRSDVGALEQQRERLTLRQLHAWAVRGDGGGVRLCWLAALVASVKDLRGGALLRAVAAFGEHGDGVVRALVASLVAAMSEPVRQMTLAWVLRGAAEDRHGEFFVVERALEHSGASAWADRFELREEMLPPPALLSADDARLALLLGKSINFLAGACGGDDADADVVVVVPAAERDLRATIVGAAETVNRRLVDAMFARHRLGVHVAAVRDYLTLSQGEFAAALLDALRDELALPAVSLARHRLLEALESAVRATARAVDGDVAARLDIRLASGGDGACGWDVLLLDYRVAAPLDAVLTPLCMRVYRRVFRWLLHVRRVAAALAGCWARQTRLVARARVDAALHALQLLRADMARFADCLVQYAYAHALDDAWRAWLADARRAPHLDGVIAAHERYLQALLHGLLLAPDAAALRRALEPLLRTCLNFAALHERLCAELRAGASTALDLSRVAGMRRQFVKQLAELVRLLADSGREPLVALAARLDFSEFYLRQEQDRLLNQIVLE
jgi:gamma-tubulin complex component 3